VTCSPSAELRHPETPCTHSHEPTTGCRPTPFARVVKVSDPLTGYVRVKAVCVFGHEGRILAIDGFDPTKRDRFWVPIGGRVEFGETSRHAITREVNEELSADVSDLVLLGVLENIFTFDGGNGHEIVFVYDGQLADQSIYERTSVSGLEDNGQQFIARWIDPRNPEYGRPVYPDGLVDLLI